MREGVGSIVLYNIIIVFIVLLVAFLVGIISYSKAFRVNSRIAGSIEKYEGYNKLADAEINRNLAILGYQRGSAKCPARGKTNAITKISGQYKYCLYKFNIDKKSFRYGVLTYMTMELPIVGSRIEVPVYSKTNKIYRINP